MGSCPGSSVETALFFLRVIGPCYAKIGAMSQERFALDERAIGVMLLLTALWGFQQVTIKWIAADAALRSIIATVLLVAWAWLRGFTGEFVFIYGGSPIRTRRACPCSSISRRRSPRTALLRGERAARAAAMDRRADRLRWHRARLC